MHLRNSFDHNPNAILETDIWSKANFNETYELHNNFGICQIHKIVSSELGVQAIKSMFDRHDISPVISGNQLIGVYKQPATVSPSYEGFFNEVWNPKSLNEQWKEFDNYLNITWFLATHDSGIQW